MGVLRRRVSTVFGILLLLSACQTTDDSGEAPSTGTTGTLQDGVTVYAAGPSGPSERFLKTDADVFSGFGEDLLKSLSGGFKPYGATYVTRAEGAPVRDGEKSMRFELRDGDCGSIIGFSDCEAGHSRHMVEQTNDADWPEDGERARYRFSVYLPAAALDRAAPRFEIFRLAQHVVRGKSYQDFGRILRIRVRDGRLEVYNEAPKLQGRSPTTRIGVIAAVAADQWVDVAIDAEFSTTAGSLTASFNGDKVLDYAGPTLSEGAVAYVQYGIFRGGIRDWSKKYGRPAPTTVLFMDEVRVDLQ